MKTQNLPQAYHCLLSAELARWIPPLMQFLHRYEGIERALEPEQLPLDYLGQRLICLTNQQLNNREQAFFNAVASLPLLYYRVSGKTACWHPGNETFQQFEKRMGTVSIWQAWTPQLPKHEIVKWMHANLAESHHVWHTA